MSLKFAHKARAVGEDLLGNFGSVERFGSVVQFDTEKVTSWIGTSHPTLTHADEPEKIERPSGEPRSESKPVRRHRFQAVKSTLTPGRRRNNPKTADMIAPVPAYLRSRSEWKDDVLEGMVQSSRGVSPLPQWK